MKDPKIWVIGDDKSGNTNQALALAEELTNDYELKHVRYNCLGKLPNWLLQFYPVHVKGSEALLPGSMSFPRRREPRKNFKSKLRFLYNLMKYSLDSRLRGNDKTPHIIITSGRRVAPIALYLKRKFNNKPKLIQIMQPALPYGKFDLVILPEHDKIKSSAKNVIRITGALSNIHTKLASEGIKLRQNYQELKEFTAVIIGGNSKNYKFNNQNAVLLASLLKRLDNETLFISFSRRTPESIKKIIKNNVPSSAIIYDPVENSAFNPYIGILAEADYIILTNDSISMCSEAAVTGKPLYIFCPSNFQSLKHHKFIKQLTDQGIAKIFDESITTLEKYHYIPLNEIKKVADVSINI